MVGDFVRDKDAVTATLLACEIAATMKQKGSNLYDYLQSIYKEYGRFKEHLTSLVRKGKQGAEEIENRMKELRENPLTEIAGSPVTRVEDYKTSTVRNLQDGTSGEIDIPKSNVLIFYTTDGSKIAARPSGTEPKIKFYISVRGQEEEALDAKIDAILTQLNIK